MDTITMDYMKIQLAQYILGISDSTLLNRISSTINDYTQVRTIEPCHYSLQEVQDRLRASEDNAINGLGIEQEDLEKESLDWI